MQPLIVDLSRQLLGMSACFCISGWNKDGPCDLQTFFKFLILPHHSSVLFSKCRAVCRCSTRKGSSPIQALRIYTRYDFHFLQLLPVFGTLYAPDLWKQVRLAGCQSLTGANIQLLVHNSICQAAASMTAWFNLPISSNQRLSQSCLWSLIIVSMECAAPIWLQVWP